jgi:hypothetical protein
MEGNEYCDWFNTRVQNELFQKVEVLRSPAARGGLQYFTDNDGNTQYVAVRYITMVNPEDVIINPFSQDRLESARKWITEKNMGRVYVAREHGYFTIKEVSIPQLDRNYKYNQKPGKYNVVDGQHRIAVTIEKGITQIIALATDIIQFDISAIENKRKKKHAGTHKGTRKNASNV